MNERPHHTGTLPSTEFEPLRQLLDPYLPGADTEYVESAFDFAKQAHTGQVRRSGAPYFTHVLEVAKTLAQLRLDREAVAAGLLHDVVEDTPVTSAELEERFGASVARIVDGVTKIGRVKFESVEHEQAENFRKMLLSMVQDIRIILVKLADRLHNMRTLEFHDEGKQRAIAQETLEIYAPLAHRMGIGFLKWQLEDLSFKYMEPEAYRDVERNIGLKRQEREEYLQRVSQPIRDKLAEAGIQAEVRGRAKHFYSIYKKMHSGKKTIEELYDLLALRVIVPTVRDCYHTLGILHTLYVPVHERFKDYIATPKINMYRSLHTTVVGPGGHFIEIQVRTDEMHRTNEYGIAAHWKYKEEAKTDEQLDERVQWLRQMLEEKQDLSDPREFMESLKIDLFQQEVFVFTPRGDLKQLPRGATPIDFAYSIHTEVGHQAVGARVNGRMVSLQYELRNGDNVDIITAPSGHPSMNWLQIARTGRARSKIRHWLKAQRYEQSVSLGREMLERALKQKRVSFDLDHGLTDVAQGIGYEDGEKLLAAIGHGTQSLKAVVNRIVPPAPKRRFPRLLPSGDRVQRLVRRPTEGIRVHGIGNLVLRFGRCCAPVPGDRIIGVVTRGRGITVHRADCINVDRVESERRIEVSWDTGEAQSFPARIEVTGEDRKNLLADISKKISSTGTNIQSGDFASEDGMVRVSFIVQVRNLRQLNEIMGAVRAIRNVRSVRRAEGE
ncbi:MAG: bifunctional (p)ppGpp synthetase/guanosine-3',5'-bis(diphosphate) 3'-pyrophosphohydrolase [Candidatus Latescibacterota bacterium]|nr:MAG: bifunctional (p)ppGpp synthetase/guanosine-3',5'-bis(diphosphate) 3'-pyrophosphohydrolase [Candidatus Latescibacterota bacterium]